MNTTEAALGYAALGWRVLPILADSKAPATQHGVHDATTDPEIIRNWFANNNYNIAIAAGRDSGIVVFDVDPRNGGEDGWAEWLENNGSLDEGAVQLTAGGGTHHVAIYDESIRSCKLAQGVDLLSDGRYFLVYPSVINGRGYEWEASSDPFDGIAPAPVPSNWLAVIGTRKREAPISSDGNLITGNRNSGLTALAGAMRHHGMTQTEILAALQIANEERCAIPLPASEVAQIARSVARYEPEHDVAANMALGSDIIDGLLEAERAKHADYYLTRATSYLSQPAPLRWAVKKWIPDNALTMIYGESGAGKTFVLLDILCHMAAGLSWQGLKTKGGVVVLLAGEGHHGLRQRVAAWCRHHSIDRLDNLLISNKSIDIDSPSAAIQIMRAVRDATDEPIALVGIDTVNNHMTGDENSARDTRLFLNQLAVVSSALEAGVVIAHHVGVAAEAKTRARGSSAWKASLDSSILVTNSNGQITVACTKMKDAEFPDDIFGKLERIPLGWYDDENEEVIGAVFVNGEKPISNKTTSKIEQHRKVFENAWLGSDQEVLDGMPYLEKRVFVEYLIQEKGLSQQSAKVYIKPSQQGKPISDLIDAGIIAIEGTGWVVKNAHHAGALLMLKGTGN